MRSKANLPEFFPISRTLKMVNEIVAHITANAKVASGAIDDQRKPPIIEESSVAMLVKV